MRASNDDAEEGPERMRATSAVWCSVSAARTAGVRTSGGAIAIVSPSCSVIVTPRHLRVSSSSRRVIGSSVAPDTDEGVRASPWRGPQFDEHCPLAGGEGRHLLLA